MYNSRSDDTAMNTKMRLLLVIVTQFLHQRLGRLRRNPLYLFSYYINLVCS